MKYDHLTVENLPHKLLDFSPAFERLKSDSEYNDLIGTATIHLPVSRSLFFIKSTYFRVLLQNLKLKFKCSRRSFVTPR